MSADTRTIQSPEPVGFAGIRCRCGEPAVKRTSKTSKNREFYCCKRPYGDLGRCGFWALAASPIVWADDPALTMGSSPPLSSPLATSSSKPSPQKQTPPSSKRLLGIEVGLRQREMDRSPTPNRRVGPSMLLSLPIDSAGTALPVPTSAAQDAPPQPPSPVPTEVDETEERPHRSFLGLDASPELRPLPIQETPPKKRRLTPPGNVFEDAVTVPTVGTSTSKEVLPTPPTTTGRAGKGRDIAPARIDDHVYPGVSGMGDSSRMVGDDVLPLFTDREDASTSSSESPTIVENILDYTNGVKERVKALNTYMDSFDIMQAMETLQTIERQKFQYECRDQSQKAQLQEMMSERDDLRSRVAMLEEALLRSEERNRIKDAELKALRMAG